MGWGLGSILGLLYFASEVDEHCEFIYCVNRHISLGEFLVRGHHQARCFVDSFLFGRLVCFSCGFTNHVSFGAPSSNPIVLSVPRLFSLASWRRFEL